MDIPKLKRRHIVELQQYDWPGNVRELQNVVERAVIRSRSGPLRFELPVSETTRSRPTDGSSSTLQPEVDRQPLTETEVRQFERENLLSALELHNWKISGDEGAADFMGMHPATLTSRMKAMGISKPTRN